MKFKYILSTLLLCLLVAYSCNKDITQNFSDLEQLQPAQLDDNAGNWKPVVLGISTEVPVTAPEATSSAAYQQELAAMKDIQANLSDAQKEAITYWSGGGILRWNQILRELVAKYNLPPVNNEDGTYPFPDASNPLAYPYFPFANPPYAARAYAYVSVAQYDALVACYAYKKQFNRPAPYKTDTSIKPLVPASDLASYPNEDAVIAGATREIMKLLFPGEVNYIDTKANEETFYKQWAGAAVESDIVAGDSLGRAIARKVVARAKTDGTKNAIGTQAIWDSLANAATLRGETPWISLETPHRPPMLPVFGLVKPWLFDASAAAGLRSPEPPSVHSAEFAAQLAEVKKYSDNPTREHTKIVHFWADGAGTYTPPGHWNAIAFERIYGAHMSEVRAARSFALLNMTMMDAAIICWNTKYYYFYPRPSQMDPDIKTYTGVPNFPAYNSGHSTFSGAAATILGHLFPSEASTFDGYATEASLSRLYGAIHYRMDCEAGLTCGHNIGQYAVQRAQTDGAE